MIILASLLTLGCAPGKSAIAPNVRSQLKDEPEITAFRYAVGAILVKPHRSFATAYETNKMIELQKEPLIPLMESFLSVVKAELSLNNIRTLPEPRHHHPKYYFNFDRDPERTYDLIQMQRTFQTGLVFDFDRYGIVFDTDFWSLSLKARYRVHLWAKARLIRVEDQKILWQGVCDISDFSIALDDDFQFDPPDADNPWAQANPGTAKASASAQEKLVKAAKDCAQELVKQFIGK